MKKFMLAAVAVLAMSMFAACGGSSKADTDTVDSVEVVVDSIAADSIVTDSLVVDTVACDTLCTCVED
ncbi:MAG: hypothetical protein HDS66_01150 [Bacteroidales bacterium]|nr:hypothetical protein [Bacteroidales bacterium]